MKRIAYIGHSFHQKTLSTQFFIENLQKHYEIDFFWTLPFKCKLDMQSFNLNKTDYHAIVSFQIMPAPIELSRLDCKNIILIPMFDNDLNISYSKWSQYYPYKFINFSKTLYDKLNFLGIKNNLYAQYAPKIPPIESSPADSDKQNLFFWQRSSEINWPLIKKLIKKEQVNSIHLHRIEAEMGKDTWFEKPSEKDVIDYKLTFSSWFESKDDLLKKMNECSVFIAPRLYEGIGQTFLEAMSLGKCVVSPDFPTMNEYIQNGHNGLLFNYHHPEKIELSNAVSIGLRARRSIKEIHEHWGNKESEIIEFIDQKLAENNNNIQYKKNITRIKETDTFINLPFLLSDFHLHDNSDVTHSNSMNFSKYLNGLHVFLKKLAQEHSELIIYGAGTGAELIINIIPENIICVIDVDSSKHGKKISGKPIKGIEQLIESDYKVLFSLFGRFEKIAPTLVQKYNINGERLISLDL